MANKEVYRSILFAAIRGNSPFWPTKAVQIRSRRICGKKNLPIFFIKSQALLDEAAILACMAYLDHSLRINRPIRGKMAATLG
jgi:hypothetical protein